MKDTSASADNITSSSVDSDSTPRNATSIDDEEEEGEKAKIRERRSLLSRRIFYNMLKQKLKMYVII